MVLRGNRPPGFDEVTTTVALTLKSFLDAVRFEIPDVKITHDENLSYESSVESFRADNNIDLQSTGVYPLFSFKRSVLRYAEPAGPGRRATGMLTRRNMDSLEQPKSSNIYRLVHGEFDVDFLYITKNALHMELFEVLYLSEEGISSYKELEVDLTDQLGLKLPYYVEYLPLQDKQFVDESVYYKMPQGQLKIRGFYPVLRANAKHILEINTKIHDFYQEVGYSEFQIKAT